MQANGKGSLDSYNPAFSAHEIRKAIPEEAEERKNIRKNHSCMITRHSVLWLQICNGLKEFYNSILYRKSEHILCPQIASEPINEEKRI